METSSDWRVHGGVEREEKHSPNGISHDVRNSVRRPTSTDETRQADGNGSIYWSKPFARRLTSL